MLSFVVDKTPRPPRAVVGGVEYTVGGWGEYVLAQRQEQFRYGGHGEVGEFGGIGGHSEVGGHGEVGEFGGSGETGGAGKTGTYGAAYGAREIGARDVVALVSAQRPSNPLQEALGTLADTLEKIETQLMQGDAGPSGRAVTVPPLAAADARAFAQDINDVGNMKAFAKQLHVRLPSVQALPEGVAAAGDDAAVIQLENSVITYIAELERAQAALASRIDVVTRKLLK